LKVVFLGTGGHNPTEKRHTACVMLPDLGFIFDAGTGFFRTANFIKTPELHIFLSHFHLDHIFGLVSLYLIVQNKSIEKVHFWGNTGLEQVLATFFDGLLYPIPLKEHPFKSEIHPLKSDQGKFKIGAAEISFSKFPHSNQDSVGFRLEKDGKSLAYITDRYIDEMDCPLAYGADLLIHECVFENRMKDKAKRSGHSYSSSVGLLAKRNNVRRLILSHLRTSKDNAAQVLREVKKNFPNTELASDKLEVKV